MIDPADFRAVSRVVMEVVAESTGYPAASIGLDQSLYSDLGVEVGKFREILEALAARLPAPHAYAAGAETVRELVNCYYVGPSATGPAPLLRPTPPSDGGPPTDRLPPHPETIRYVGRGTETLRMPRRDPPA
jgi:hypothetical protein